MYTDTIVTVLLAALVVVFYLYARNLWDFTQNIHVDRGAEYHVSVEERIRPFGQVYLSVDDVSADEHQVDELPTPEPVATVMTGPQVFNAACIACHGSGVGGAPTLDDPENWAPRIAQGIDTLYLNAIEGFTGAAGYMPPKGARLDLSDGEVNDAVDYMVAEVSE